VIGDIPWVAQSVEAYLSKLFACSYSAAGIAVYSANPSDHLVHRMTHRVVRGCLLACGRPDGRLSALTSCEAAVCLSVNQASSIQSIGSTCESMTIGHNPYKLSLTKFAVFLSGCRKKYMCEHLLEKHTGYKGEGKSSGGLLGDFANLHKIESPVIESRIVHHFQHAQKTLHLRKLHSESVRHTLGQVGVRGSMVTDKKEEEYFGQRMMESSAGSEGVTPMKLVEQQTLSMRLYESRIASLQRAVAFFVMFHQMGKDVQVIECEFLSFGRELNIANLSSRTGGQWCPSDT
jgi:hypothetical protein